MLENKFFTVVFFILVFLMQACTLEQRLALKYQKKINTTPILFIDNPLIYLSNSKIDIPDTLNEQSYDSAYNEALEKSKFLADMDAEAYWNQCDIVMNNALISSGFNIMNMDSISVFVNDSLPKFIFEVKQFEVEEYLYPYTDYQYATNSTYFLFGDNSLELKAKDFEAKIVKENNTSFPFVEVSFPINAIALNYWIEVNSYLKGKGHQREIIFIHKDIMDVVTRDSSFDVSNFSYINKENTLADIGYRIDSLSYNDLWLYSGKMVEEVTEVLESYVVNKVIDDEIHQKSNHKYRKRYWILNSHTARLIPTDNDMGYTVLERFYDE